MSDLTPGDWGALPAPPQFADLGLVTRGEPGCWATFSPCERYRYALGREWDVDRAALVVVALNPSTATHEASDPTLRKLCHYARRDGFGSLLLCNVFALRATDSREVRDALLRREDAAGPANDEVCNRLISNPLLAKTVAAWGAPKWRVMRHAMHRRAGWVLRPWWCWGLTADGHPRHPLYLRNDAPLVRWSRMSAGLVNGG